MQDLCLETVKFSKINKCITIETALLCGDGFFFVFLGVDFCLVFPYKETGLRWSEIETMTKSSHEMYVLVQ